MISCSVSSKSLPDSKYCHSDSLQMTQWRASVLKGQQEASPEAHEFEMDLVPPFSAA